MNETIFTGMINYNDIYQIMKPVYNTYEEFLFPFDKMRIALFTANWQKKGVIHIWILRTLQEKNCRKCI